MLKTVWMNTEDREIYTSREEFEAKREQLILTYMEEENSTREEAENAVDYYIEDVIPAVEIDLDSSCAFWVDYTNQEIMTNEEVCQQAEYAYSIEEWLNAKYSAAQVFIEIQTYGFDDLIDGYLQDNFDAFVEENDLEYLEIED